MISALCTAAGIRPIELDAFGCGAGPGSFTGVRIGTAAVQALARAAQVPVVMVNSLDVLAYRTAELAAIDTVLAQACAAGCVCARRSRANAYYLAWYPDLRVADAVGRQRGPMSLCENVDAFVAWCIELGIDAERVPWVGEHPEWLGPRGCDASLEHSAVAVSGAAVLALTLAGLNAGAEVSPAAALPVYLPEDSPWRAQ